MSGPGFGPIGTAPPGAIATPPTASPTDPLLDARRGAIRAARDATTWEARARWLGEFTWRLAVLAPLAPADLDFLRGALAAWEIDPE